MYRVSENPPSRYPEGRPFNEDLGKWMVAHLRSRREKIFAKELQVNRIGYYLPLYVKRTRRRDTGKPRKSVCPLFPGYMAFVKEPNTFRFVIANKNVANVVKVVDQKSFIKELAQIQQILDRDMSFQVHRGFVPGTAVCVKTGSLKGIEGVVLKSEKETRLVIGIEMFGQSISVAIDEAEVERIRG